MTLTIGRLPRLAALAALILIVSVFLLGWTLVRAQQESCAARNQILDVIQALLMDNRAASFARNVTPDQAIQIAAFYRIEFSRVDAARC